MTDTYEAARRGIVRTAALISGANNEAARDGDDTAAAAFELMVASITLMRCLQPGKDISEAIIDISADALAASEHFFKLQPDDGSEIFAAMIEQAKTGFQS